MHFLDKEFPIHDLLVSQLPALQEIPQPPERLFMRGSLPMDVCFLAVVGSRAHTSYGKAVCENLIASLASYPICIVSGLALGIDGIAHRAALNAHLSTIAFPGSGLGASVLYPSTHRALAQQILTNGGALISEFEKDFRATPWSFPKRNRLVAGIADAVLVIEAGEKSGALITARFAVEYNKTVLAIPGQIYSEHSKGTNWLLRAGAVPITKPDDILEALQITPQQSPTLLFNDLTEEEQKILALLVTPLTKEELGAVIGVDAKTLNIVLSSLEIKGYLTEVMGKLERIA